MKNNKEINNLIFNLPSHQTVASQPNHPNYPQKKTKEREKEREREREMEKEKEKERGGELELRRLWVRHV